MTNIEQYVNKLKNTCAAISKKVSEYLQVDKFCNKPITIKEAVFISTNLVDEVGIETN